MNEQKQTWFPLDASTTEQHRAWGLLVYRNDGQTRGHVAGTIVMARMGEASGGVFVPHELMPAPRKG